MNVLILEDEPLIAQRLNRMIREVLPSSLDYHIQILHHLDKAKRFVEEETVDLCFLDLNLSGQNGFDLIDRSKKDFQTIITSAYTEKAIEAFRWEVLDFVPKPFRKERIEQAIQRFLSQRKNLHSIIVQCQKEQKVIPLDHISFIKAAGNYAMVVCKGQKQYLHTDSIGKLSEVLGVEFIRIHKSFLVPKCQIKSLRNYGSGKYEVILSDGKSLPVSRNIYPQLQGQLIK